jgi:hypothetical protein
MMVNAKNGGSGKMKALTLGITTAIFTLADPLFTWAGQSASHLDTGDTAWLLVSTALVMLMTPGLALFCGGMARRKNVLNTIMLGLKVIMGLRVTDEDEVTGLDLAVHGESAYHFAFADTGQGRVTHSE